MEMQKGVARMKGENGADYLMSFDKKESDKDVLNRGEEFYGVKMVEITNRRYIRRRYAGE